jgi:hypothetical protein
VPEYLAALVALPPPADEADAADEGAQTFRCGSTLAFSKLLLSLLTTEPSLAHAHTHTGAGGGAGGGDAYEYAADDDAGGGAGGGDALALEAPAAAPQSENEIAARARIALARARQRECEEGARALGAAPQLPPEEGEARTQHTHTRMHARGARLYAHS